MLCYVMLRYVMSCYVMLCHVMLCYVMLNFNRYSNVFSKTIAFTKRKYYIHIFGQCQRDMKKTWATLSDILIRNTKKS